MGSGALLSQGATWCWTGAWAETAKVPWLRTDRLAPAAGLDYIATPAIQGSLWQSFIANGQLVEWHSFSDENHGFRHPDNEVPAALRRPRLAARDQLPAPRGVIGLPKASVTSRGTMDSLASQRRNMVRAGASSAR